MKYLFLFDIDGTILNFQSGLAKDLFIDLVGNIYQKPMPSDLMPDFNGRTDLYILRTMTEAMGISNDVFLEKLPLVWEAIINNFTEHSTPDCIELLPGVASLLNVLQSRDDVQLGLVTGNFNENAYLKLNAYDLGKYFPVGAFGSDHENRNMLPPIAINKANQLHSQEYFSSDNTLIIGDTVRDVECAKVNGIKSVAVATGRFTTEHLNTSNPDLLFENFSDYRKVEEAFFNLF